MIRKIALAVGIALLLCARAHAGQPTWIVMQNDDFRVYSSARERDTRDMLGQLELIRGFFNQITGAKPVKAEPVLVVIFGTEKEYQPYRINSYASAYYAKRADRDYIVIGKPGEESSQITSHEYTHLAFAHAGYSLPPWLNEGIADLFSTLHPRGDWTLYGDVLPGRLQEVNREPWVPLQVILAADHSSPYYNESSKAGALYDESWALVHMLATSNPYRAKFWDMVKAVNNGTPSVQALEQTFGMPMSKLEDIVQSYIRGDLFNQLKVKVALQGMEKLSAQPANALDVREIEAAMLAGLPGRQDEARTRFEQIAREDTTRPGPWSNLGYLAWEAGDHAKAAEDLGHSFDLGNRSPKLLLDYAHLSLADHPEHSVSALKALVNVQPEDVDARLFLAQTQMRLDLFADALATVKYISSVKTPEQRDNLLYLRAFTAMQLKDCNTARLNAEQLKHVTSTDNMRNEADYVLDDCRIGADSGSKEKASNPAAAAHNQ